MIMNKKPQSPLEIADEILKRSTEEHRPLTKKEEKIVDMAHMATLIECLAQLAND